MLQTYLYGSEKNIQWCHYCFLYKTEQKLLLLLLSHFSHVWLCATPQTAHQAPPSLGFSRQENWSGLPFPSPVHEKVKSLSRVWLLATPWTLAHQAPPSMGFSSQEYWSGVPLPSPIPRLGFLIYIFSFHKGESNYKNITKTLPLYLLAESLYSNN